LRDGTAYGTAHRNDGGHDWYDARMYWGVDESQDHTYGINWQADRVSFSVDGRDAGTVWMDTRDAAHGGSNVSFAVMNRNDNTSITVYDMSYSPWG
jgi:beta-glucanase (GH16 family)